MSVGHVGRVGLPRNKQAAALVSSPGLATRRACRAQITKVGSSVDGRDKATTVRARGVTLLAYRHDSIF